MRKGVKKALEVTCHQVCGRGRWLGVPAEHDFTSSRQVALSTLRRLLKRLHATRPFLTPHPLNHLVFPSLFSRPPPLCLFLFHHTRHTLPTMRANALLALGCYAAVASARDVLEEESSSVSSAASSAVASDSALPEFTVRIAASDPHCAASD